MITILLLYEPQRTINTAYSEIYEPAKASPRPMIKLTVSTVSNQATAYHPILPGFNEKHVADDSRNQPISQLHPTIHTLL